MEDSKYWFEQAPVGKAIIHMAVPMIFGMAMMCIYNFADTLFVGMLQDTASLAAVTLCLPFSTLTMAVADLFGVGGSTLMARSIGADAQDTSRRASAFMIWGGLVASCVLVVLAAFFPQTIAALLGASEATLAPTMAYLQVVGFGAPLMVANLVLGQQLRAVGASKESMIGMIGSALLNIVLDPVLIFVAGWGVAGAALATVAANGAAVMYYLFAARKSDAVSFAISNARLPFADLVSLLKIGSSAMLLALLMSVSSLAFNSCAMAYGDEIVAAFGISQSIVQLIELVAMGLYEGVVPLIAASYGARNAARIKSVVKTTVVAILAYCGVAAVICFAFRGQLIGLFSTDPAVLAVGGSVLMAQLSAVIFASESGLITGCFQAFDAGTAANAMSIVRGGAIIPLAYLGSLTFGASGLIWSLLAAEVVSFAVACILLATKRGCFSGASPERQQIPQAA